MDSPVPRIVGQHTSLFPLPTKRTPMSIACKRVYDCLYDGDGVHADRALAKASLSSAPSCPPHTTQRLRQRQMRNMVSALLLSCGVPMINMGDEYGHSKAGNNNTYCHDSELNYVRYVVWAGAPYGLWAWAKGLTPCGAFVGPSKVEGEERSVLGMRLEGPQQGGHPRGQMCGPQQTVS